MDKHLLFTDTQTGDSTPPIRSQESSEKETIRHQTEGGNAMPVFYYGFPADTNTYIKIEENTVQCAFAKLTNTTFCDYPMLCIDDLSLDGCVFENCHTLYLTDCKVHNCSFEGVQTVYATRTPISGCQFQHLRCDNDCVICLEDSEVSYCTFEDCEMTGEAYLVNGVGDVWIESCCFENIRTAREDRELFFCEETVGKLFKKKVQFCIVDEASCKGLQQVLYTGIESTPADPKTEVLNQAAQKGLLTEAAMEAIREGIGWDETRWDSQSLGLNLGDLIVKIPVYNCLTRAGLRTVGDLVKLNIEQILQIQHIGKVVIHEVVTRLHSLNIIGSAWDYLV